MGAARSAALLRAGGHAKFYNFIKLIFRENIDKEVLRNNKKSQNNLKKRLWQLTTMPSKNNARFRLLSFASCIFMQFAINLRILLFPAPYR